MSTDDTGPDAPGWFARPLTRGQGLALLLLTLTLFVVALTLTMRNRQRRKRVGRQLRALQELVERQAPQQQAPTAEKGD